MHSMEVARSSIPGFISKLWNIVEDPATNDLISWSSSGSSFIIHNHVRFSTELLPKYFKHSNMASFIRQLNMYGFRKVVNVDAKHRGDNEDLEFYNGFFCAGEEHLLEFIKRKPTVTRGHQGQILDSESQAALKEMLDDMQMLHGKQASVNQQLASMQRENAALWKEIRSLRQKHDQQQQLVNQLIQFFFDFLQKTGPLQIKRKVPSLMGGKNAKLIKLATPVNGTKQGPAAFQAIASILANNYLVQSPEHPAEVVDMASNVNSGPVIHEIIERTSTDSQEASITEDDTVIPEISLPTDLISAASPAGLDCYTTPALPMADVWCGDSPRISVLSPEDPPVSSSLTTPHWSPPSTPPHIGSPLNKNNFETHVEGTDTELHWLQDQIKDSQIEKEIEEIFKMLKSEKDTTGALTSTVDPPLSVASPHSLRVDPGVPNTQKSVMAAVPVSPKNNVIVGNELADLIQPPPPSVELEVPVTPLDFDSLLGIEEQSDGL